VPDPGERTIGVAIPIPDPYGSGLQRRREAFGDPLARSIPTHITLVPPMQVTARVLAEIERHLREVADEERPFPILLRGTGTFRPVSPVVFVALAVGISECENLERRLRRGPLDRTLGFPYHPHVTVAHHLPDEALDEAFKELSGYEAAFPVWGFSLYEHGEDGVWRPQRDFAFGAGLPPPSSPPPPSPPAS
jgi:2'-5' RNA ligase